MNTTAAPRLVLLLKSGPGTGAKIAHQAGFALYGGRWHKITPDKPAPKGAPVAAHPKSAGHHEPAAHFTDDQWAALKLPDSNVNAPTFNAALAKLKAWSDAGDVTAIVGASYGVNTYGVKLAKIANTLLGMHGSAHKVVAGQKPGTHAASQVAEPADPHPTGLPEHLAPKAAEPAPAAEAPAPAASGPLTMPDFEEGKTTTGVKDYYQHFAQQVIDHGHAGNVSVLENMKKYGSMPNAKGKVSNTWAGKTANSKKLLALHEAALAHAGGGAAPAAAADPLSVHDTPASKVLHVIPSSDAKAGYEVHVATPKSAPGSKFSVAVKDVDSGEFLPSVKMFPKESDALEHAHALAEGKKPGAAAEPFSVKSAKPGHLHNEGAVHTLHGSDFSGVEKALGLEPGDLADTDSTTYTVTDHKGRTFSVYKHGGALTVRTSGKNTDNASAKELLAHLQDANGPKEGDTKSGADGSTLVLKDGHWVKQGDAAPEIKSNADGSPIKPDVGAFHSTLTDIENWIADGNVDQLHNAVTNLEGLNSVGAKAAMAYAKAGIRHLGKKAAAAPAPTGNLSAQQLGNLQSIPWFKLKLPAENTNAKSHNAALAKIEAMAFAGDTAGLKAFVDSKAGAKQTYAKKQALTAQTALAALGVEGATAAVPVEPAPAADTPVPANVKKTIDGMSKDENALKAVITNNAHNPHVAAYAASKLAALKAADPHPLVNEWKAAIVAGKVPTKAQADAFDALGDHDPDAQQEYFLDSVTALIDATPGVSQFGPDFDAAYAAANDKVHELHGHALAGTKPTRAAVTADTPLTAGQKGAIDGFSTDELKSINDPSMNLPPNVAAYVAKKVAELEKPAAPAATAKVKIDAPLYQNTTDGHNKFWAVSTLGSVMKTTYGKIGTKGQETAKTFASEAEAKAAAVKLMNEKKAKGYGYAGHVQHEHDAPAAAVEQGPKEGDTKQGADGMLVLKNGHWVKAGEDMGGWDHSASNPGLDGNPSLELSKDGQDFYLAGDSDNGFEFGVMDGSAAEPDSIQAGTIPELVGQMKAMGYPIPPVAALQKLDPSYKPVPAKIKKATLIDISTAIQTITPGQTKFSTNAAGKMATSAAKKGDGPGMAAAHTKAIALDFPKTATHIKAVADAMGVDTSGWAHVAFPAVNAAAPAPAAPPAAPVSVGGMLPMDGWAQTGGQGGSNPGGKFKDPTGQEWYCKFPKDADTAKSEILAAKLYALAGLSSQDAVLVTKGGKVGIASKWVDIKKAASPGALAKVDGAQAGFAVDAWLGNWDVVGLSYDNLQVGPDGKAHRVDAGGSLEYRAQGEKKAFGSKVEELDTLLDAGKNAQTASVFKGMTKADLTASAAKVLAISDVAIRAMVNQYGPGDAAAKAKLADTLIARKKDIAAKFPAAAKKKKAPVFKPEEISAPPSFLNWGGGGKSGPSSKEFLNKANEDAVQAIFAAAKTGDADAVKKLTAPVFDKDTGAVTGHKPVLEHPSQHVKGYAQQAVNEITYQLNPPKQFRFDGGHPLHSLNAAYPAHKGSPSSAVAQKLGKFIVLGEPGTVSLDDAGLPEKIVHSEGGGTLSAQTYAKQAQAAIAKMPATQKQAVKSYTGSSYHAMNGSLWSGNPTGAAKAAGEALKTLGHDIAPGTVLSRKISLHGADLQQLLGASGKILQEPAIMSTSIRPSSWSGNVHLKLHVGPGVKGLWVGHHSIAGGGALSSNSGEDEMILPPGTRLMILGVKTGADKDGFGKSSGHVVEAIILPTE